MTAVAASPVSRSRLRFAGTMRFVIAVLAAQTLVGSVLLLGWLHRRMAWRAMRALGADAPAPNWIASERLNASGWRRAAGGLADNLRAGLTASFALGLWCLPPAALLAVSWFAGWNNSFSKGYEYAAFGPLTGVLGIVLSALCAAYLPFAHARFAATGELRRLFAVRSNLKLLRGVGFRAFSLPAIGILFALLLTFARSVPMFAPQIPPLAGGVEDPAGFLNRWFLVLGFPLVGLLIWLKSRAVALYVMALQRARAGDWLTDADLAPFERAVTPGRLVHAAPGRWTIALPGLHALAWTPVYGLLYVQQFVNNLGARAWLDHPLFWLPYIGYSI